MYSNKEELDKFRDFKGPLIDVRSPGEYYKGNMSNSINIPLFNDEERSIVGKIYKNIGKEKATLQGLIFLEKKIDNLINNLLETINHYKAENNHSIEETFCKIYCARGGMRSYSISWLLERFNIKTVTLKGGYKNYRKWTLDSFYKKWNIIVLGGKTGTGKTKLLKLLEKNNFQIIDLEGMASHRGSTFGSLGMRAQPSNEQFENLIAEKLRDFNENNQIFVEAESSNIGQCRIPHIFFNQMKIAKRIEIIKSESNRIEELIRTYSIFDEEDLKEAVLRIKKRLGPQRTKIAIDSIKNKDWKTVCKSVMEYYDKCYEYEKVGKKNIITLDLTNIFDNKETLKLIKEIL